MKIKSYKKKQTGEVTKEYAENIFNELLSFQGYGFNKSLEHIIKNNLRIAVVE